MILHLTVISAESEDFCIRLRLDAGSTFLTLHKLILRTCGYQELPGQRFFICDDNWKPETRILLSDEGNVNIDEDVLLMSDTELGEFLEDEGQHLTYRFDPENRRMFLLELTETSFGQEVDACGEVGSKKGKAPRQLVDEEIEIPQKQTEVSEELGEEFYGEDGFDSEEIDEEGFDILSE
ncbi:MAG: hypothetical protein K2F69_04475 [Bacteroidaceae bacterium]|nr:hypothetical protein [Bacteroidaceae bacterium]